MEGLVECGDRHTRLLPISIFFSIKTTPGPLTSCTEEHLVLHTEIPFHRSTYFELKSEKITAIALTLFLLHTPKQPIFKQEELMPELTHGSPMAVFPYYLNFLTRQWNGKVQNRQT